MDPRHNFAWALPGSLSADTSEDFQSGSVCCVPLALLSRLLRHPHNYVRAADKRRFCSWICGDVSTEPTPVPTSSQNRRALRGEDRPTTGLSFQSGASIIVPRGSSRKDFIVLSHERDTTPGYSAVFGVVRQHI